MAIAPNNLTPEEIEAKNEDAYESLLSLIEDTQGQMALIIAACDSMAQRERIIKRYEADAWAEEKVRPFRIRLGQEPSLRAGLAALEEEHPYLKEEGRAVVSVTGAELLLRVKITGDEAQTELEKFFGYLQWTREALRAFRYPVVLWVSREILREMSRRAPDFWSWRKAVLRFEDEAIEPSLSPQRDIDWAELIAKGTLQTWFREDEEEELPPLAVLLEEIEKLEDKEPESFGLATLYVKLGQIYAQRVRHGDALSKAESQKAVEAFQQAIRHYKIQKKWVSLTLALFNLAEFYDDQSQFDKALKISQMALEIAKKVGDCHVTAIALGNLGSAYASLGQYQQALNFQQRSLDLKLQLEDFHGAALSWDNLGSVHESLGQYQQALKCHQQSLEFKQQANDLKGQIASLGRLGNVYISLDQYTKAISLYQKSLDLQQQNNDPQDQSASLGGLGNAYHGIGQYQKSIEFQQQALRITQQIGDRSTEALLRFNLARTQARLNNYQAAKQNIKQAQSIFTELNLDHMVEKCEEALYQINSITTSHPKSGSSSASV